MGQQITKATFFSYPLLFKYWLCYILTLTLQVLVDSAVSSGENEYINAVSGDPVGANGILWESDGENEYTNEPHNNVVSNTSFVPSGNLANKQTWKFYAPCNIYAFVYSHYNKDPCLYRHPVDRMTLSVTIVLFESKGGWNFSH